MHIPFFKYQGAGNDFVIIDQLDNTGHPTLTKEQIEYICSRRFGIGADGLMILSPSDKADFRMIYYNANGLESTMCGNGGRCIVMLAAREGHLSGSSCTFEAIDGIHRGQILDIDNDLVSIEMTNVYKVSQLDNAYVLDTGSPHYVTFVSTVEELNVKKEGSSIRYNSDFLPGGINVNFAQVDGEKLSVRTYERGVEDETLACGTGVVATAIAYSQRTGLEGPLKLEVAALGGNLSVQFKKQNGVFKDIWLTGPAEFVFSGVITI